MKEGKVRTCGLVIAGLVIALTTQTGCRTASANRTPIASREASRPTALAGPVANGTFSSKQTSESSTNGITPANYVTAPETGGACTH